MAKMIDIEKVARSGGQARFKQLGREGMTELAGKGGRTVRDKKMKEDPDYYRKIRAIRTEKERQRKEAEKYQHDVVEHS